MQSEQPQAPEVLAVEHFCTLEFVVIGEELLLITRGHPGLITVAQPPEPRFECLLPMQAFNRTHELNGDVLLLLLGGSCDAAPGMKALRQPPETGELYGFELNSP